MKELFESFRQNVSEASNTLRADVNEIMFASFMAHGDSSKFKNNKEAMEYLEDRKTRISPDEYKNQEGRAEAMHKEVMKWAAANGWDGSVTAVWWTARPGVLEKAIGGEPSRGNPTDILLEFDNEDFLGISAKSTKSKGDIGFKNPGARPIGNALGIDMHSYIGKFTSEWVEEHNLPKSQKERKKFLREEGNEAIRREAEATGYDMLMTLRDTLYKHLAALDEEEIRQHIVDYWCDAGDNYPYYIKATGHGDERRGYSASISDPIKNEKYKALMSEDIEVFRVGDTSIGIKAGRTRIMKMRFKFESQKMASGMKMSGDPW
jgi:hypothetical protein